MNKGVISFMLKLRDLLFIPLLGLTISILFYPVTIKPDYPLPIQSMFMFHDFPIFTILFYSWIFMLLVLLFSMREKTCEKIVLCFIFSLVFIGFWILKTPLGLGDAILFLGELRLLRENGSITLEAHQLYPYFDFPGIEFIMLILAEICGFDNFQTGIFFLISLIPLFNLILFVFFLKHLKDPFYASVGVILLTTSSILIANNLSSLHASSLSTFYIGFLTFLLIRNKKHNYQDKLLFALLVLTTTIEYLFNHYFILFLFLSIYVVYRFFRIKSPFLEILMISGVFSLIWQIYYATFFFTSYILYLNKITEDFMKGKILIAIQQVLYSNVGPTYPWWGNCARIFWWLFIFGFGTLLMFTKLFNFKSHNHPDRIGIVGTIGSIIFCLSGALITKGAVHGGLSRYLWIAPFFIVPTLIKDILSIKRKLNLTFLFFALLVLSFPTFLTNQDSYCYTQFYPQERSLGEFVEMIYDKGDDVNFYSCATSGQITFYYTLKAKKIYTVEAYGNTEEEVWQSFNIILESFFKSKGDTHLFIFSEKMKMAYWEYQGITPENSRWKKIKLDLLSVNEVYSNGFIELFKDI